MMVKHPKPEPDDKEQSERFIQTAKELESNEDSNAFERLFGRIAHPKQVDPSHTPTTPKKGKGK
jgi:hypothetical protein